MRTLIWHISKILMFLAVPVCAYLWAFSGAENTSKNWRRWGCGTIVALLACIIALVRGSHWWVYLLLLSIIPLSRLAIGTGYGVPDPTDEGSYIGQFWFEALKLPQENRFTRSQATHDKVNLYTRWTTSCLYALSLLPLLTLGLWFPGAILTAMICTYADVRHQGIQIDVKPFWWFSKVTLNSDEILNGVGYAIGAYFAILY